MSDAITLKDDFTFLLSDAAGDVLFGMEGQGMYLRDTRYLSRLELSVNGQKPHALSYTTDYNIAATFRLSSHHQVALHKEDDPNPAWMVVSHAIGIARRRYIRRGLVESIELSNFHSRPVKMTVSLRLGVDFVDIFEVRGLPGASLGHRVFAEAEEGSTTVRFTSGPLYKDKYSPERVLLYECDRKIDRVEQIDTTSPLNGMTVPEVVVHYDVELPANDSMTLNLRVLPEPQEAIGGVPAGTLRQNTRGSFLREVVAARRIFTEWQNSCTTLETGNYLMSRIYETGTLDLRSLMQREPGGLAVTAGLPWYFTLFGRDSLITAIQTLSLNPQLAVDQLRVLAGYQATGMDDWRDAEPGKILHEMRRGDMTMRGEMPHSPYYGSVDSTLLYMVCFAETLKWNDDRALFEEMWPSMEKALEWARRYGDMDGDGYIEFKVRSPRGILHQGWKDSDESMGGPLGPRPSQPVALAEVQGYYYQALAGLAETIRRYGGSDLQPLGDELEAQAAALKEKFNRDYWWEEGGFYAQALDARKQQVRSVTSNIGHCLWSGIVDAERAGQVVSRLMQPDMLSGWGIRTISALDPTYNPMSYHNGSIWPHDNALVAAGMRRYGYVAETLRVAREIYDAALRFPEGRLPELYCGFPRGEGDEQEAAPAAYPVSCSPQAWAAGTPMLLLQSLLGMEADARLGTLTLAPALPEGVNNLTLRSLRVGQSRVTLTLWRDVHTGQVALTYTPEPAKDGTMPLTVILRAVPQEASAEVKAAEG